MSAATDFDVVQARGIDPHLGWIAAARADLFWRQAIDLLHMAAWRHVDPETAAVAVASIASTGDQHTEEIAYEHAVAVAYNVRHADYYTGGPMLAAKVADRSIVLRWPNRRVHGGPVQR